MLRRSLCCRLEGLTERGVPSNDCPEQRLLMILEDLEHHQLIEWSGSWSQFITLAANGLLKAEMSEYLIL